MKEKIFVNDLRNSLYVMQILRYLLADLKELQLTETYMKVDANNIINSINRFILYCMAKGDSEQRELLWRELEKDELKDVGLLLDFASKISNVGELVDMLNQEIKVEEALKA